MPSKQIINCTRILKERQLSLAFAESASAGRVSAEFASAPDAEGVLKGGIICYDIQVKRDLLGIDPILIEKFTPESSEVSIALAYALRNQIESDIAGCNYRTHHNQRQCNPKEANRYRFYSYPFQTQLNCIAFGI